MLLLKETSKGVELVLANSKVWTISQMLEMDKIMEENSAMLLHPWCLLRAGETMGWGMVFCF